jgi:hypothetical protein
VAEPASEWVVRIPLREKKKIPWKILFQVAIVLMALGLSLYLHQFLKETEKGVQNAAPAGNSQEGGGRKR